MAVKPEISANKMVTIRRSPTAIGELWFELLSVEGLGKPQLEQKLAEGGYEVLHRGQI
ncbi:MAG TPA: hypothetical protein VLL52_16545 [Anaerolineae bacterium]|nr:hypothetical protein [Anaerolineae bacterium]